MLAGTQVRGRPGGGGTRPSRVRVASESPRPNGRRARAGSPPTISTEVTEPQAGLFAELSHCPVSGGAYHGQGPGIATKENCRTARLR